ATSRCTLTLVRTCAGRIMIAELRNRFRASFIMSDAPIPITSAQDLLADVRSRPVWDGASISPADAEYPRVHVDWHEGHGFVFQCYEDEESWSDFLDEPPFLDAINRSGAWRTSARTMAPRTVRLPGTRDG